MLTMSSTTVPASLVATTIALSNDSRIKTSIDFLDLQMNWDNLSDDVQEAKVKKLLDDLNENMSCVNTIISNSNLSPEPFKNTLDLIGMQYIAICTFAYV